MSARSSAAYAARLLREGVKIALSQWVASVVALIMAAGVCVAVLATTGQSATTESNVLSRLNSVSGRVITVVDQQGQAEISPASVAAIQQMSGVAAVFGLGPAFDVRSASIGQAGTPVPIRRVYGRLPAQVRVVRGAPRPGDVLIGPGAQRSLGFEQPAGGVVDDQQDSLAVVGSYRATDFASTLSAGGLLWPASTARGHDSVGSGVPGETGSGSTLAEIYVVAASAQDVPGLLRTLPGVVVAQQPKFTVSAPVALIRARTVVSSELSQGSRTQMIYVLLGGLVLEAVTMLGAVSQRRRDFGRRRALGASRSAVVVLVLAQTVAPAALGVIIGSAVGVGVVERLTGSLPPWSFTTGLALLALLGATVAAVPPAVAAALRDPVRILRVP